MSETFSAKLELVLKALSISRGRLAADLGVDKSVVGRWVTGAVKPSSHNLSGLTALIAGRVSGFKTLDWDRSFADLANLMGADPSAVPGMASHGPPGLPLAIADHIIATTSLRGSAYEGFFKSTRPYVLQPGRFVHDHAMVRLDPSGYLRLRMGTAGTVVEGWVLTQFDVTAEGLVKNERPIMSYPPFVFSQAGALARFHEDVERAFGSLEGDITRLDDHVSWELDGSPLLVFEDRKPLRGQGHEHFAFSGWEAPVYFDNLVIEALSR